MTHTVLRFVFLALSAGLVVAALLRLFAPQLYVLAGEGFPAPVLSDHVTNTPVAGLEGTAPLSRQLTPLPEPAQARFEASSGRALLVEKGGVLLHAHYGEGMSANTQLNSYSLVKSLIGGLVLKAVDEGRIAGLETSFRDLLGPEAPDVTLASVLSMTSGLSLAGEPPKDEKTTPVDDASFSPFSPVARLHAFGVEHMMPRLSPDPALVGRFHYQSVNTALLGRVLEDVYDVPLEQILSEQIWMPAGAATARWRTVPATGGASAYCCLYARAEDWVRVGRFVLNNGRPDAPFLSEAMWQAWVAPDLPPEARRVGAYGWHLRHDVLDRESAPVSGPFAYMAGHGGQRVYLLPEQDAVVVRFGDAPQLLHSTLYEIFAGP